MRLELEDTQAAPASALDRTATASPTAPSPARAPGDGLAAGKHLGHFRVERQLGAGGMGEVYLATDLALDRPVAIKVLPDALARDAQRRDKLIREARAQARVVHPNVGHIYYIGEEHGLLFVAMEFVPGETLAQRAAKAPMPIDDALAAIRGAALGLREAHRAGFLHRDVKPSNLMLDSHGETKVLDFGLAAGGATQANDDLPAGSVTQTSLGGTPLYMAPEQARGEALDQRSDIYALGATLFHLVSGRPPFEANTADELRDMHSSAPRPRVPASTQPRVALAIGQLCARMMAPLPANRFASYDELIAAIDTLAMSRARPAGFWARSIATGLDLLLALIVVSIITALTGQATQTHLELDSALIFAVLGVYQILCTKRWGRTAGKALLDLEVVRADTGDRLTWGDAIRRSAVLLALPIGLEVLDDAASLLGYEIYALEAITAVIYTVTILCLAYAAARTHGKRAPWDRLSGTLVRYRAASKHVSPSS